jgi:hypothetical protein
MAGFAKDDILGRINQGLQQKFGEDAPTVTASFESPEDILAYACLVKDLAFAAPFERINAPWPFHWGNAGNPTGTDIKTFGIPDYRPHDHPEQKPMAEQVTVLFYRPQTGPGDPREFALRLATTSPDDELVLAIVNPRRTLLETFEAVQQEPAPEGEQAKMQSGDVLKIPLLRVGVIHSFDDFLGRPLKNPGFESYVFRVAQQDVHWARVVLETGEPRLLAFDRPFLLWLRQKDAELPYFFLWIATPEFMVRP